MKKAIYGMLISGILSSNMMAGNTSGAIDSFNDLSEWTWLASHYTLSLNKISKTNETAWGKASYFANYLKNNENSIYKKYVYTDENFPNGWLGSGVPYNGGVVDAFRHIYFSALLTINLDLKSAIEITDKHESYNDDNSLTPMDYHNNWIGILIGYYNSDATENELYDIVYNFVFSKDLETNFSNYYYNSLNNNLQLNYTRPVVFDNFNTAPNLVHLNITEHATIKGSIFDGAGSLVSPNDDCWGCDKDEVRLHKHPDTGSTGVFQWLHDDSTCSQIDIHSNRDLGDVIIKSKSWSNNSIEDAFKVNMGSYDKISLKNDNSWTTFSITTTQPLNDSYASLYAYCKTDSDTFYNANRVSINKDLVEVSSDYYWTGTGSLITKSNNNVGGEYGYTKDVATTLSENKSLTSFQWYANSECREVVISKGGYDTYVSVDDISIKDWADSTWDKSSCSSLPCTLGGSNYSGYKIIKVKTKANALSGSHLQVKCK